jgi:hypothetical protein
MLSFGILSVVMINVVLLSVVAPCKETSNILAPAIKNILNKEFFSMKGISSIYAPSPNHRFRY